MLSQEQEEKAIREGVKRFLFVQTEKKKKETKKNERREVFFSPNIQKVSVYKQKEQKEQNGYGHYVKNKEHRKTFQYNYTHILFLNFFIHLDVYKNKICFILRFKQRN